MIRAVKPIVRVVAGVSPLCRAQITTQLSFPPLRLRAHVLSASRGFQTRPKFEVASVQDLEKILKSQPAGVQFVDVREVDELAIANLGDSFVHLPTSQLKFDPSQDEAYVFFQVRDLLGFPPENFRS
eukprot:c18535_g1_i2.p1 GENE.c18535_g1_i2~~c18535_g1_i2.p1  ORF type:complete len:138 (-),score=22.27 c18535_g1_i2:192-572(-)